MDDDFDLKHFDNVCRLFPLSGVVLFPHAVLPLHIFEPRYRQMTEDALSSDRLLAIVQVRPPTEWESPDLPGLEAFGCLGRIFKHERLPDGRFNFLLLGRKRIELTREVSTGKLYRMAEVQVIDDVESDADDDDVRRAELIALFREHYRGVLDPDLDELFENNLPLGVLSDIVAQAMGLSARVKQSFLAEPRVGRRVDDLLGLLRREHDKSDSSPSETPTFPPPFSKN